MSARVVTRREWGARAASAAGNQIGAHPLGVAVHWEGPGMGSRPHAACYALVRQIQAFHMDTRGWADIAYSFLVCEHGAIFEGRGLGRGSAANGTTEANRDFYAVCGLVGEGDAVPVELLDGISDAIGLCRIGGAGIVVVGHGDLFQTACPGPALRAFVKAGARHSAAPKPAPAPAPKPKPAPKPAPVPSSKPAPKPATSSPRATATVRRLLSYVPGRPMMTGPDVVAVQHQTGVTPDGTFGPATARAVKAFQVRYWPHDRSAWDGTVGPKTARALGLTWAG